MISTLKNLSKHSVLYGFGSLLNRIIGFILLPVYTKYLTPADYGVFSLLTIIGNIALLMSQMGIGTALFREIIYVESDESTTESTALFFLLIVGLCIFAVLSFVSPYLSKIIFNAPVNIHLLQIVFLTTFFSLIDVLFLSKIRIKEQAGLFSILAILKFSINISLNIFFIVYLRKGVEGLVHASFITAVFFALIYFIIMLPELKLTFSVKILKNLLSFGLPLVPASIASLAMKYVDRFFLQHYSTMSEVGLYSLGYNIGLVMNMTVQAFQMAWPSHMFAISKKLDAEYTFAKILTYYLFILGFIGLAISTLSKEILFVMVTPEFYGAYKVIPLIVISYILYGVSFITNTGFTIHNKMKFVPPIFIVTSLLNLLLNFLFIPEYGMIGAALATILSYLCLAVIHTLVNQYFWKIPYEYKRIGKIIVVWIILYGCGLIVTVENLWLSVLVKTGFLFFYPFLLYFFNFFTQQELNVFKQYCLTIMLKIKSDKTIK